MASAHKAMMARRRRGGAPIINDDIALEMERLFDHYNMDHIPVNQRLDGFKHRNLPLVKHYKAAVNIFGGPASRKRVIIAPPMETPLKRRLGLYMNVPQYPQPPILNNSVKPPPPKPKVYTSEEIHDQEEKEKERVYKDWYSKRQGLRANLDNMGLNEDYLHRKTDKSELEKRVQHRMKAVRTWKPESPPPPEPVVEEKEPPVVPNVKVPVPAALQILDSFLAEKKIRLIDLFRNADRNRDWRLTKEELQGAVRKYKIPLSHADVEDLMICLDKNFDELLDFKEISQGLAALKTERRATRRKSSDKGSAGRQPQLSPLSKISPLTTDQMNSNQNSIARPTSRITTPIIDNVTAADIGEVEEPSPPQTNRLALPFGLLAPSSSADLDETHSRSGSPNSLGPPPSDMRDERRVCSSPEEMVELRKHDRAVLHSAKKNNWPWKKERGAENAVPGVIRIGHKAVDAHCLVSSMEGESGSLLDEFRRKALKEYFRAVRICQEKGLILNAELLDRVLLYPPELTHVECMKKLAIPKGPLADLPADFAKPPKKPKTPPEIRHKDKIQLSRNGTVMIDTRHMYPPLAKIAPVPTKENLSTGRALVQRKSDIWMSFEEYDKFTKGNTNENKHLPRRFKKLDMKLRPGSEGNSERTSAITGYSRYELEKDKFWPGYMLDKLVMYEPDSSGYSKGWALDGPSCAFQPTHTNAKPGNLGKVKVTGPPIMPDGRITFGGIDHRRILPK